MTDHDGSPLSIIRRATPALSDAHIKHVKVLEGQTFAEATSGVPDTVKEIMASVGFSVADATRALDEYRRA